jgi:hypothetical protein
MRNSNVSNASAFAKNVFPAAASALAVMTLLAAATLVVSSQQAVAKPEFAAQTGKPCGQCHANPAGGGKLKAFGEKFKANGNKVK